MNAYVQAAMCALVWLTITAPEQDKLQEITLRDSEDDLGTFHQLSVKVWWYGEEPGERTDMGKTYVELYRQVYVRR